MHQERRAHSAQSAATLLRLESLCCLIAILVAYRVFFGDWRLFLICFLLPDLSLLFYLWGTRVGSVCYNLAHNQAMPFVLLTLAIWPAYRSGLMCSSLIWLAHVHFDRTLGYGLKAKNSFQDTHLGSVSQPKHVDGEA